MRRLFQSSNTWNPHLPAPVHTAEIHEAVGTWYETVVFVRSQEDGLSLAQAFGI